MTLPSSPALASVRPSGLKATALTSSEWPRRLFTSLPVTAFQTRTRALASPLATHCPSRLTLTEFTKSVGPLSTRLNWPVPPSHSRTRVSSPPVATSELSALALTARNGFSCPCRVMRLVPDSTSNTWALLSRATLTR